MFNPLVDERFGPQGYTDAGYSCCPWNKDEISEILARMLNIYVSPGLL